MKKITELSTAGDVHKFLHDLYGHWNSVIQYKLYNGEALPFEYNGKMRYIPVYCGLTSYNFHEGQAEDNYPVFEAEVFVYSDWKFSNSKVKEFVRKLVKEIEDTYECVLHIHYSE